LESSGLAGTFRAISWEKHTLDAGTLRFDSSRWQAVGNPRWYQFHFRLGARNRPKEQATIFSSNNIFNGWAGFNPQLVTTEEPGGLLHVFFFFKGNWADKGQIGPSWDFPVSNASTTHGKRAAVFFFPPCRVTCEAWKRE
jgi:hypothetical protein